MPKKKPVETSTLVPEVIPKKEGNEMLARESNKIQELEHTLEDVKKQHLQMAKLLQAESIKAMQDNRARILRWRDAMDALKTGIELERKIRGMEGESSTPIVNIIATNKSVISKYVEGDEDGEED